MEIEPKMLKMLKKKKKLLNLQNQLFITSIHLLQINGKKYIKAGIDDWQVALKQLVGKMLFEENTGENDPTMSLEDARFRIEISLQLIFKMHMDQMYDPRTGEILESHIGGIIIS
jgi:hypothetical protein